MAALCCRLEPGKKPASQTILTGFLPHLSLRSLSAPCRSRSWTTLSWPYSAAACSGVNPFCAPHAPKSSTTRAVRKESGGGSSLSDVARREDRAARDARGPRASTALSLSLSRERDGGGREREGERESARATRARGGATHVLREIHFRPGGDEHLGDGDVAAVCCPAQRGQPGLRERERGHAREREGCHTRFRSSALEPRSHPVALAAASRARAKGGKGARAPARAPERRGERSAERAPARRSGGPEIAKNEFLRHRDRRDRLVVADTPPAE